MPESIVNTLKPLLDEAGYPYREDHMALFVPLPYDFGQLEIADLPENDDLIGLAGEEWHTHSSCLCGENLSPAEKVVRFLHDIENGRYLLIKEQQPGQAPARVIEDDLESYQRNLPANTTYKIYNET